MPTLVVTDFSLSSRLRLSIHEQILFVKEREIVFAIQIEILVIYWHVWCISIACQEQVYKSIIEGDINLSHFDHNFVHAHVDQKTSSWHQLEVDEPFLSEVIFWSPCYLFLEANTWFILICLKVSKVIYLELVLLVVCNRPRCEVEFMG